jgi:hypothetical protein
VLEIAGAEFSVPISFSGAGAGFFPVTMRGFPVAGGGLLVKAST